MGGGGRKKHYLRHKPQFKNYVLMCEERFCSKGTSSHAKDIGPGGGIKLKIELINSNI